MDFIDAITNFLNVIDSSNLAKKHFTKFNDRNEYTGNRIISFFAFILLLICYTVVILGITFLVYKSTTVSKP